MADPMIHPKYGLLSPFLLEVRRKVETGSYTREEVVRQPKRQLGRRRCKRCGDEFAPLNSRQKYCAKFCMQQAMRDRYRASQVKLAAARPCAWCGKAFSPKDYRRAYCSAACRREVARERYADSKRKEGEA